MDEELSEEELSEEELSEEEISEEELSEEEEEEESKEDESSEEEEERSPEFIAAQQRALKELEAWRHWRETRTRFRLDRRRLRPWRPARGGHCCGRSGHTLSRWVA